jgi:hypothetical protein
LLRSEIIQLQESVSALLENNSVATNTSYQHKLAEQVTYVQNLCVGLKKKWTHELLSSAKEPVIKRYVQFHQAGIVQLSDRISAQVPALNLTDEASIIQRQAYLQVNASLEEVLDFLRHQFYQYFDIDHKATFYYCQLLKVKVSIFEPDLKAYDHPAVDNSLIKVLLTSVEEIVTEGEVSGISFRLAEQTLKLARFTHQLLFFGNNATTATLLLAFYQQNVNTFHFYHWYQVYLSDQLAVLKDEKDKQVALAQEVEALSGIFVSPDKALQPELPATDTFIKQWLQEQINPKSGQTKRSAGTNQLPLNLSVPQFALFIRICYKTSCFPVENVAMITRFFTEHFTTKKQPHISHKSFGRAFYNLDQPAAAVVRDFLQKMLNYLNKTYFP